MFVCVCLLMFVNVCISDHNSWTPNCLFSTIIFICVFFKNWLSDLFSRNNRFIQQKQKRIFSAETKTDLFSRNNNGFIQQKQKRIYSAETKTDLFSRNKNGRYIFFIRKFLLWIRCGMETCKQRIPQNSVDKSCN